MSGHIFELLMVMGWPVDSHEDLLLHQLRWGQFEMKHHMG